MDKIRSITISKYQGTVSITSNFGNHILGMDIALSERELEEYLIEKNIDKNSITEIKKAVIQTKLDDKDNPKFVFYFKN